jgi:putative ABC transport system permease protein
MTGMCVAVGGTLLAASGAFVAIARLPLLAAGQARAMAVAAGQKARVQASVALALLLLSLILGFTADGLIGGFVFLGAMLVGASLALPLILDLVLRVGRRLSKRAAPQWFWADTRQQLPGLSLALMALLLAMAANVGVSTMVSSFRLTFVAFLDQRLASELYVSTQDAAQTANFVAYADGKVDAILPIRSVEVSIRDLPTELFAGRDHSTYRDNWVMLDASPAPWDDVYSGESIIINEQLSRRAGIAIGDLVQVQARDFTVSGIYGDYGNPIGQALIAEGEFDALFPDIVTTRFGLRLPQGDVADFVAAMERDIDLPASATINQANIKALSLGIFDRTFTVTGALNVLTLAVAGFAILMSLLTLATMRVPQLAPVWAVGMTRRRIGRLELARAVLLAALTSLLALPLGLVLAWALLAIVNVAAFGWKLPMFLFPAEYLKLFGFGLLAALLAALWPSYRLARTPPSDLLKVFANER